jgi:hypothetical protein
MLHGFRGFSLWSLDPITVGLWFSKESIMVERCSGAELLTMVARKQR